jgi:hypothetical protein
VYYISGNEKFRPLVRAFCSPRAGPVAATFTVCIPRDGNLTEDHLASMLAFAQDLGLGHLRAQGFGTFLVTEFERIQE